MADFIASNGVRVRRVKDRIEVFARNGTKIVGGIDSTIGPALAEYVTSLSEAPKPKPLRKLPKPRTREEIELEASTLERKLESLIAELREIQSLPPEPEREHTIVTFQIRFNPWEESYDYAALKVKGTWWLTGRETGGRTWTELLQFMSQDCRIADDGAPIIFRVVDPEVGAVITQAVEE